MPDPSPAGTPLRSEIRYHLGYRFLRLFADIRQGEAGKVLLLALNVFLLLLAYYILKPLREALLLVDKQAPLVKSYLSGAQAILFVFVIKAFSRLASKVPRHILITWTTSFFIFNLVIFYFLNLGGMAVKPMGIMFFIWIGIFNYFVIAQFWGFANDLYSDEVGKRTFPLVALGATLGGLVATLPIMKQLRDILGKNWQYKLMLIAGAILFLCIVLAWYIHRREVRKTREDREKGLAGAEEKAKIQEQPLKAGGGFRLIFKSRYLLLIAVMIGLYNFVNATGEFIITKVTVDQSIAKQAPKPAAAGLQQPVALAGGQLADALPAASPAQPAKTESKAIHNAFMDYQFKLYPIRCCIDMRNGSDHPRIILSPKGEHEANEMPRPTFVLPAAGKTQGGSEGSPCVLFMLLPEHEPHDRVCLRGGPPPAQDRSGLGG